MPRRAARESPREGTRDMLMSRNSAVRARLGNDDKVSIDYIEACGDCFYMAMEAALSELPWDPRHTVAQQRALVATRMTEETFKLYTMLHAQEADGFHFMSGVDSLEALRRRVLLRGQKVGAHRCVWADGFAMETISTFFRVLLLVIDERFSGNQKFTRISPAAEESGSGTGRALVANQHTVLLHVSAREHTNLIRYGGKKLQQLGDLPAELQKLWGICVRHSDDSPSPKHDTIRTACGSPSPSIASATATANANSYGAGTSASRGGNGIGGGSAGNAMEASGPQKRAAEERAVASNRTLRPRKGPD
mmetsp:Transcript_13410/g.22307  ORF Transcript_13410/g.22307 Transcript_13410/m.22307 type:complete len:307 (+) Transcript_13410:31-951(+)